MQVQALINGSLYKTYAAATDAAGNWDPKPINFSIIQDRSLGLLAGFEPITQIKLVPQHQ
jgi:hypothetical protein